MPHAPCCTCGGCGFSSDTFGSSLGGNWTVDSGTWSTSGGELIGTGTGLIYDSTVDPDGVNQDISLTLKYAFTAGGGETFRFLIRLLDTSNYLYAEITRAAGGSTSVTLGEVVAGVDTTLSDAIPIDTSLSLGTQRTLHLCYFHSTETLRFYSTSSAFGANTGVEVDVTSGAVGNKAGIQIVTGNGEFDDYAFGRAYNSSDKIDCDSCNTPDCFIGDSSLSGSVNTQFWETVTGSWGTDYEASGDSILRFLRPHPLAEGTMYAAASAYEVSSGNTVRVYVNYLDSNNHLYAEAGWDSTTVFRLSLYSVLAGTPTLLDERFVTEPTPSTFDKNITLVVCYDGATLSAEATTTLSGAVLHGSSATTEITGGKWFAIGSNGGVKFYDFLFEKYYSGTDPGDDDCPICPASCGCVASHVPRGNYTVDFGAGGWTDDGCGYCDQIAGEFVLGEWIEGTPCRTVYIEESVCAYTSCAPGVDDDNNLRLILSLVSAGGGQLKWQLDVYLGLFVITDPSCDHAVAEASYESAAFDTDECDIVPRTLSKTSDAINQAMCDGALPATITIDET